ncbi:MAG: type 4a pilus biogenesis protein PilO [bacterium]
MDWRKNQPLMVGIGGVLLLGVIIYFAYMYTPLGVTRPAWWQFAIKIDNLEKERERKQIKLDEAERVAESLPQLKKRHEELQEQLAYAQEKMPKEKEMPELLRRVTEAADQSDLDIHLFHPEEIETKETYIEVPIKMEVSGTYHNLGSFLSQVGSLPRIVTPNKLKIEEVTPAAENAYATVRAELIISTFVFKEN